MQFIEKNKQKLEDILSTYNKACTLLTYEEVLLDKKLFLKLQKQKNHFENIVSKYNEILNISNSIKKLEREKCGLSVLEQELYQQEITVLKNNIEKLSSELDNLLNNLDAVFQEIEIEILFNKDKVSTKMAKDLSNAYTNFCKANNLNVLVEEFNNKYLLKVNGLNAKEYFIGEIGNHVSISKAKNENCQVFVYEDIKNEEYSLNENEVSITTCRSSGAGGQHVNTTDSSIKVTHIKTGITAVSQDERSQIQNKQKALERLDLKLKNFYQNKREEQLKSQKKQQLDKIKNNFVSKVFDYENGKILVNDKMEISIRDFLQGKKLN